MDNLLNKYYEEYEGEPEIQIIRKTNKRESILLRIWSGYFDNIMCAIQPESGGWTSLAYYYHLDIGWYEESPWAIENIDKAREQLKNIDTNLLDKEDRRILKEIIRVFEEAILVKDKILIAYE